MGLAHLVCSGRDHFEVLDRLPPSFDAPTGPPFERLVEFPKVRIVKMSGQELKS